MGHPGAQAAHVGLSPEHMHMTHSIDGPLLDANMGFQYVSLGGTGSRFGLSAIDKAPIIAKTVTCSLLLHRTHSQVDQVCEKFLFHFHGCVESFLGVLTSEPSLKLDKEKNSATKKLT